MARNAEASGFRILGTEIELVSPRGVVEVFPAGWVIVHDPSGDHFPPCSVFLVRALRGRNHTRTEHGKSTFRADSYHGSRKWPYNAHVEIPHGPWKRLASVKQIRYRRSDLGPMEHDYERAVSAYESSGTPGVRLGLPDGCTVSGRGFVWP